MSVLQVVIVPVIPKKKDEETVMGQVGAMQEALLAAGVRSKVDTTGDKSPGWKFNFWEMKGVPVRLEVGPRDVAKGACVLARRDKPGKEGKQFGVPAEAEGLVAAVQEALGSVQVRVIRWSERAVGAAWGLLLVLLSGRVQEGGPVAQDELWVSRELLHLLEARPCRAGECGSLRRAVLCC